MENYDAEIKKKQSELSQLENTIKQKKSDIRALENGLKLLKTRHTLLMKLKTLNSELDGNIEEDLEELAGNFSYDIMTQLFNLENRLQEHLDIIAKYKVINIQGAKNDGNISGSEKE